MQTYTGYIYLWFDTIAKLYYVGGHKGKVNDCYIASNKPLLRAYKLRPQTFRFRILEYVYGDNKDLRAKEQRWLDMIKDHELLLTRNVLSNTHRYYNVKTHAAGGNGVGTNKGNSNIGGWNRGKTMSNINGNAMVWKITDPKGNVHLVERSYIFCREHNLRWSTLWLSWKHQRPLSKGKYSGYKIELVDSVPKLNQKSSSKLRS